jgi:hypothetical protein
MDPSSSTSSATYHIVRPAPASNDPPTTRGYPAMVRKRLEVRACSRRQESTFGLRLINLERRARFYSFTQ